jgi:hypothetical protein
LCRDLKKRACSTGTAGNTHSLDAEGASNAAQSNYDLIRSQGLNFDIRKGSHSIGSNVRDATAYALWSLARAQDVAQLEPFATELASQLVNVAVYDREVHIRRAASAAFQEFVGRTVSAYWSASSTAQYLEESLSARD